MGTTNRQKQLAAEKQRQDLRALQKQLASYGRFPGWNPFTHGDVISFTLSGVISPGICHFPEIGNSWKWLFQTGPGLSGANPVYLGQDPVDFEVICRLYDNEDWDQFNIFIMAIPRQTKGKAVVACPISHPILDITDPPIRAVTIDKWRLRETDERGVTELVIWMHEFRPIKVDKQATVTKAKEPDKAADPVEQFISRLTDRVQAEAGAR